MPNFDTCLQDKLRAIVGASVPDPKNIPRDAMQRAIFYREQLNACGSTARRALEQHGQDLARLSRLRDLVSQCRMGGIASNATLEECVHWIDTGETVEAQRAANRRD